MKRPTLWDELGKIFAIMAGVCAGTVALMVAVFHLADAEHHPLRATIMLVVIVVVGMGVFMAYSTYRSKLRSWEQAQEWEQKLGAIRKTP